MNEYIIFSDSSITGTQLKAAVCVTYFEVSSHHEI